LAPRVSQTRRSAVDVVMDRFRTVCRELSDDERENLTRLFVEH
jgi:hypothetical protein